MPRFHILALSAVLMLTACASGWEKPGATTDDFTVAQKLCSSRASVRFPPAPRQILTDNAYATPSHQSCFGNPDLIDCTHAKSVVIPPQYTTVDDNEGKRNQDIKACLMQNGWQPTGEER